MNNIENIKETEDKVIKNLIADFRTWQFEWDKYANERGGKKPKDVEEFIAQINEKYTVIRK